MDKRARLIVVIAAVVGLIVGGVIGALIERHHEGSPPPTGIIAPLGVPSSCVADFIRIPVVGPACLTNHHTYLVQLRDGSRAETHGQDPPACRLHFAPLCPPPSTEVPSPSAVPTPHIPPTPLSSPNPTATPPPSTPPASAKPSPCVTSIPRIHIIYAHPNDVPDKFSGHLAYIRQGFAQADALLNQSAQAYGHSQHYRVACDASGQPAVDDVALSTSAAGTTFASVVSDLREKGYTESPGRYLAWVDDDPNKGGVGSYCPDDDPGPSNCSNGRTFYAVNFGGDSRITMHELGHTLGAVQDSSPHNSGNGHCNDGVDIMCYADGGSNSHYSSRTCPSTEHWDCNLDDYWNPSPSPGSYLSKHWNVFNNQFLLTG